MNGPRRIPLSIARIRHCLFFVRLHNAVAEIGSTKPEGFVFLDLIAKKTPFCAAAGIVRKAPLRPDYSSGRGHMFFRRRMEAGMQLKTKFFASAARSG
jgi:hypothetical protein